MSVNLYSHSIRACICLRRKFNNQQNAQHTFPVHYKYLRPALVNLTFWLSHTYAQHSRATVVSLVFLWTGMFPFKFHFKYFCLEVLAVSSRAVPHRAVQCSAVQCSAV